ncbi:MAG: hypothetical protein U9P10_13935 [Thermodesulfobacteriota bacterium]|nr:hypothetical protein [Thermodesulfobacteriota bacterium]
MNCSDLFTLVCCCFVMLSLSSEQGDARELEIDADFSGQVEYSVTRTRYDHASVHCEFREDDWIYAGLNLRLKNRIFFGDNICVDTHYVMSACKSDLVEASDYFTLNYPQTYAAEGFKLPFDDDSSSFLDLSSQINKENDYFMYHRIDRLNLNLELDFGRICLGRQAVTWGNGLIFNPMDIFNPFSPYDTERDYKKGVDMAFFEIWSDQGGDLQFIYVPGRDPRDNDIRFSSSSLGMKYHFFLKKFELDIMAGRHYKDTVAGIGISGPLGNAVFRTDIIHTCARGNMTDDFSSFVFNIDYSWVFLKKNIYGLVEYYYSGLGTKDYSDIFTDYDLSTRISRGEIFGLSRQYLSAALEIELTPLLNFNLIAVANLGDPSYLVQPKLSWNIRENLDIKAGANIPVGGREDEYGMISIPMSAQALDYGTSVFVWTTFYF